ncbi:MAG: DUF4897 domain-containing protein [Thermotogae bacterium]|nr:DUF4897 domain-containing protein [Thermotogota bacterium]
MSNFNKFLIVLIVIMAAIMVFQIFWAFSRRPNFTQVYYRATYTFSKSGETIMDHVARFAFKKYEDFRKTLDNFRNYSHDEKKKAYVDVMARLSKDIGQEIKVISYNSTATEYEGLLQIHEIGVVKGFIKQSEDGVKEVNLGDNEINLSGDSRIIFVLPKDSEIVEVEPTPSERKGNILVWNLQGKMKFPKVKYKN